MEKLLSSKNIHVQVIQDLNGEEIYFAYTKKLLELNILIEYYGVTTSDDDSISEEVAVFVYCKQDTSIHTYVLFVSDQVLGPLPIYRLIVDAVEFIEHCDAKTVLEEMKAVTTSYEILDKAYESPEFYENAIHMHDTAMELIAKKRAPLI